MPDLQNLCAENCNLLLDFDAIETNQLGLLERARLFVMLKYGVEATSVKQMFNNSKFKTTRHIMPSDSVLPSKSFLIKICKTKLKFDYHKFNLGKIPS